MTLTARIAGAAAALAMMATAAFADVAGRYAIQGQNPDGSSYRGSAEVQKTGDTYRVTWTIDGQRYVGTGIGSDEALAITYRSGNNTGVALLFQDGPGYKAVWTFAGGTTLGAESWVKR